MATFSGVPWSRTIDAVYNNGSVTKQVNTHVTSWIHSRVKPEPVDTPPYVPGVFNVKPYYVSSESLLGEAQTIRASWTTDIKKVVETWQLSEHLMASQIHYTMKNLLSDTQNTQLALQEAYGKLNAAQWDALTDLAEIGGTFDLIKDGFKLLAKPATGLPALLRKLRNPPRPKKGPGNYEWGPREWARDAKKGSERAADAHLTYRYGIMPLILSIQDALELLKKQLEKAGKTIRTVRRRPAPLQDDGSVKDRPANGIFVNQQYHRELRIEAIVYYRRTMDQTLQSALGLVPENIPSVLWEITTLSFVWDWFFHIGDFLNALKPKVGVEVLGATTSQKKTLRNNIRYLVAFSDAKVKRQASKPYVYSLESFERTVVKGGVVPTFVGFDDMTIARWADACALSLKPLLKTIKSSRR